MAARSVFSSHHNSKPRTNAEPNLDADSFVPAAPSVPSPLRGLRNSFGPNYSTSQSGSLRQFRSPAVTMEARLRELRVVAETAAQSRENPEVAFKNVMARGALHLLQEATVHCGSFSPLLLYLSEVLFDSIYSEEVTVEKNDIQRVSVVRALSNHGRRDAEISIDDPKVNGPGTSGRNDCEHERVTYVELAARAHDRIDVLENELRRANVRVESLTTLLLREEEIPTDAAKEGDARTDTITTKSQFTLKAKIRQEKVDDSESENVDDGRAKARDGSILPEIGAFKAKVAELQVALDASRATSAELQSSAIRVYTLMQRELRSSDALRLKAETKVVELRRELDAVAAICRQFSSSHERRRNLAVAASSCLAPNGVLLRSSQKNAGQESTATYGADYSRRLTSVMGTRIEVEPDEISAETSGAWEADYLDFESGADAIVERQATDWWIAAGWKDGNRMPSPLLGGTKAFISSHNGPPPSIAGGLPHSVESQCRHPAPPSCAAGSSRRISTRRGLGTKARNVLDAVTTDCVDDAAEHARSARWQHLTQLKKDWATASHAISLYALGLRAPRQLPQYGRGGDAKPSFSAAAVAAVASSTAFSPALAAAAAAVASATASDSRLMEASLGVDEVSARPESTGEALLLQNSQSRGWSDGLALLPQLPGSDSFAEAAAAAGKASESRSSSRTGTAATTKRSVVRSPVKGSSAASDPPGNSAAASSVAYYGSASKTPAFFTPYRGSNEYGNTAVSSFQSSSELDGGAGVATPTVTAVEVPVDVSPSSGSLSSLFVPMTSIIEAEDVVAATGANSTAAAVAAATEEATKRALVVAATAFAVRGAQVEAGALQLGAATVGCLSGCELRLAHLLSDLREASTSEEQLLTLFNLRLDQFERAYDDSSSRGSGVRRDRLREEFMGDAKRLLSQSRLLRRDCLRIRALLAAARQRWAALREAELVGERAYKVAAKAAVAATAAAFGKAGSPSRANIAAASAACAAETRAAKAWELAIIDEEEKESSARAREAIWMLRKLPNLGLLSKDHALDDSDDSEGDAYEANVEQRGEDKLRVGSPHIDHSSVHSNALDDEDGGEESESAQSLQRVVASLPVASFPTMPAPASPARRTPSPALGTGPPVPTVLPRPSSRSSPTPVGEERTPSPSGAIAPVATNAMFAKSRSIRLLWKRFRMRGGVIPRLPRQLTQADAERWVGEILAAKVVEERAAERIHCIEIAAVSPLASGTPHRIPGLGGDTAEAGGLGDFPTSAISSVADNQASPPGNKTTVQGLGGPTLPRPLEPFTYAYLHKKYGLRWVALRAVYSFFTALVAFASHSARIRIFIRGLCPGDPELFSTLPSLALASAVVAPGMRIRIIPSIPIGKIAEAGGTTPLTASDLTDAGWRYVWAVARLLRAAAACVIATSAANVAAASEQRSHGEARRLDFQNSVPIGINFAPSSKFGGRLYNKTDRPKTIEAEVKLNVNAAAIAAQLSFSFLTQEGAEVASSTIYPHPRFPPTTREAFVQQFMAYVSHRMVKRDGNGVGSGGAVGSRSGRLGRVGIVNSAAVEEEIDVEYVGEGNGGGFVAGLNTVIDFLSNQLLAGTEKRVQFLHERLHEFYASVLRKQRQFNLIYRSANNRGNHISKNDVTDVASELLTVGEFVDFFKEELPEHQQPSKRLLAFYFRAVGYATSLRKIPITVLERDPDEEDLNESLISGSRDAATPVAIAKARLNKKLMASVWPGTYPFVSLPSLPMASLAVIGAFVEVHTLPLPSVTMLLASNTVSADQSTLVSALLRASALQANANKQTQASRLLGDDDSGWDHVEVPMGGK